MIKRKMKKQRYGKTSKGIQRIKDLSTGKVYLEEYQRPGVEFKFLCIMLYINGLSYRRVGSLLGVSNVSVMKWHKKYSDLFDFNKDIDRDKVYDDVEIDELFTFCKKKAKNFMFGLQSIEKKVKF